MEVDAEDPFRQFRSSSQRMPDPPGPSRSLPHMVCCDLNQRAGIPLSKVLKNSGQQGGGLDDSCSIPITPETLCSTSQATRPKKRSAQRGDAFQTWYATPRRHVRRASTSTSSSTTSGHTLPVHWKFSIYIYNAIIFAQADLHMLESCHSNVFRKMH